jgi:murein DD-endopeptidase MepM/ murein hydrolase activator NlpD
MALIALAACARPRIPVGPVPERGPEPDTGVERSHAGEEDADYVRSRHLLLPVAGVRPDQLSDSFDEPRDGNRRHHAIDILAPRGTPVLAADDGVILRRSWNSAGGNSIYAADSELRIVYYYAHLDHYRDSLAAGMRVARGDTIGFVGTTGNAPKDIPHLHFQIMRMPRDGKYWNGDPMNPFALLRVDVDRDHIVGKRD